MTDQTPLVISVVTGVFTVLWWLLRSRDEKQAKQIDLLFDKHDVDSEKLVQLELKIASSHYIKPELDNKFRVLETSIKDGMHDLGTKFDRLSAILIEGRN